MASFVAPAILSNTLLILFKSLTGFPCGSDSKEFACSAGHPGLISASGRSLENGIANHSSILAWRMEWTEEFGELQSMGSQRVRHD